MVIYWVKMVLLLVALYAAVVAYMYFCQRQLVFQPGAGDPFLQDIKPFESFSYRTPDNLELRGLWYPPKDNSPIIVYFHGNAGSTADRVFKGRYFIARGYGVAIIGYHGYSGNPGMPSEENLYNDGRAAINALIEKGHTLEEMVLYGESLGTGVATQLATEFPEIKSLVLEAPYTSIADVASHHYPWLPVHGLVKDRFESAQKIGKIQRPVLIIHGTKDRTVPFIFGERLFIHVTAPQKKFIALEGASHEDVYDFGAEEVIHEFIKQIQ